MELVGYKETTKKRLLSPELAQEISALMPLRYQSHSTWNLAYSLEQDGASLRTMYQRVKPVNKQVQNGYVVVIRDATGSIFGAYANTAPVPHERFFGNGDCFLWRSVKPKDTSSGRFEAFPYTGVNDFCMNCSTHHLSFGTSDGHYGIWVDDDLHKGVSYPTLTYGNPEMSSEGKNKFRVIGFEVWIV